MNKKGLAGWLVDFYALGMFVIFVIIMLFVFRFSHAGFRQEIKSGVEGTASWVTLRNLLDTNVGYMDEEATLGDLVSYLRASSEDAAIHAKLYDQINNNLSVLSGRINIYNVAFTASIGDIILFETIPLSTYVCKPLSTSAVLPMQDAKRGMPIYIEMRYCEND